MENVGCADLSAGGDISPLAGEIGCPPPHFSDQFNHMEPNIPMKLMTGFKHRPQYFPSLGMYVTYYNKKHKKRTTKRNRRK